MRQGWNALCSTRACTWWVDPWSSRLAAHTSITSPWLLLLLFLFDCHCPFVIESPVEGSKARDLEGQHGPVHGALLG